MLKKAIIPSLKDDYFTQKIYGVDLIKQNEKTLEFMSYEDAMRYNKVDQFQENFYSDKKEILDVKRIAQNPDYPNGCESVSAVMLLNYYGFSITVQEFIDNYLPKEEVYEKNGIRYGPNPALFYAGNPLSEVRGWGCFAPVIEESLKKVVKYSNYVIENTTGRNINYLIKSLPVVIWVGMDYEIVSDVYEWFDINETKVYTYPKNAHAVLLIGYDHDNFYINDPLKPEEVVKVKRKILEDSYDSMGRQSVAFYNGMTGLFK